ncbi:MAG: methylated-DNA--[protein]-cysteine S-methyltransferase [Thermomicrobiales bacterium]
MENDQTTRTKRDEHLPQKAAAPGAEPCDLALEAMPGYVIGDMVRSDEAWIDSHTEQCNYCRNELHWFERIDNLLEHLASTQEADAPRLAVGQRDARFGTMPSPVGDLLIAVSDEGICEIAFGRAGNESFLDTLRRRGFDPVSDQQAIEVAASQLREYFNGRRHIFDLQVDLTGVTPFTRDVLNAAADVPFGHLVTYRDIARSIGKPNATRAVGNALGRNPVPVVVPCHRIVRSDHSIGGYTGGLDIKERLLSLEGAALPSG